MHEVQRCSRAHQAASGSGACLSIPAVCTREREHAECTHGHTYTYPPVCYAYERPFARCAFPTPGAPFSLRSLTRIVHLMHRGVALVDRADRDVNDRELRQGMGACGSTNDPPKIITIRAVRKRPRHKSIRNRHDRQAVLRDILREIDAKNSSKKSLKINYPRNKIK